MKTGLTQPQLDLLADLADRPLECSIGYTPAQTLVKLRFATWGPVKHCMRKRAELRITDDGRLALKMNV